MFYTNFDHMFSDLFNGPTLPALRGASTRQLPVEVHESDKGYFLSFDVPGIKKEDINIEVRNGTLTVSGERKTESHEDRRALGVTERSYGFFSRSFTLPEAVDSEKIEANFDHGVLEIAVPKAEAAKARRIEIASRAS